ncbi:MAG: hypothetical protein C4527_23355 [Candidatus Omnitrophota bacterium]|nr:MAG: hypothetical protein C4527_23355 [Candidatus Omnitrophota bacterium]
MRSLNEWIHQVFEPPLRRVLFRVDAGAVSRLSFGHASRCRILAKILWEKWDAECLFLMQDFPEGIDYIRQHGFRVRTIDGQESLNLCSAALLRSVREFRPDWLVLDVLELDPFLSVYDEIRSHGSRILVMDDCRFQIPPVDVYFNSSILAHEKLAGVKSVKTRLFLGPRYFIFDEELLRGESNLAKDRFNVVLTFGGSDVTGMTVKTIEQLVKKDWPAVLFTVILGPGFSGQTQLGTLLEGRDSFRMVLNPPNVIPYLRDCDFALCAGGRTMYELIYLGKNFLSIPSVDHEVEGVEMVKTMGLNRLANEFPHPIAQSIAECLRIPIEA